MKPETVKIILTLLDRVTLKGSEVQAYVQAVTELQSLLKEDTDKGDK